jgi:hypothetical protein
MPTIAELATELGLDASTFKPEAVAKWNGFLTDAETQYKTAKELKDASEQNLRQVAQEQTAINAYIEQYGASETTRAALEANLAAYKAVVDNLKTQGINVDVPALTTIPAAGNPTKPTNVFDENKFRGQVSNVLAQSINLNNKYQTLYGKPLPDDIDALADQASKAGKQLFQYAAEKYDFAGEEKRKADAATEAERAKWKAEGAKEYAEKNPNTAGNPFMNGGGDSRNPQILKRHDSKDLREYANLTPREKIARSIANSRELLAANQ